MVADRVLLVVSLVYYSIALHAHRTAPENAHLPKDGRAVKDEEKGYEVNNLPAGTVFGQQPQYPAATQQY